MSDFHGAFATGVASQQGTLTLPDTWFRPPFWDLLMLQLLRPNSSNLPCLYSTFHLEYPLVLSRFYFIPHIGTHIRQTDRLISFYPWYWDPRKSDGRTNYAPFHLPIWINARQTDGQIYIPHVGIQVRQTDVQSMCHFTPYVETQVKQAGRQTMFNFTSHIGI